jgi:hypothetical protein
LADDSGPPVADASQFRGIAGALQYLTFIRADIAYAVQQICLHMHDPREPHLTAMKRILRYLRGTPDFGLLLCRSSSSDLVIYTDVVWCGVGERGGIVATNALAVAAWASAVVVATA